MCHMLRYDDRGGGVVYCLSFGYKFSLKKTYNGALINSITCGFEMHGNFSITGTKSVGLSALGRYNIVLYITTWKLYHMQPSNN